MAKNPSFFRSLSFKISVFITSIMLLVLAVISASFIVSERREVTSKIIENGRVFAEFSRQAIYDNYVQYYTHPLPEDFENFKLEVEKILKSSLDVEQVSLVSTNGKILFSSSEFEEGKYSGEDRYLADEETLTQVEKNELSYRELLLDGQKRILVVVPTEDEGSSHIFSAVYVFSFDQLNVRMREVHLQMFALVTVLTIGVVAVAILFSLGIVRPIKSLTKTAKDIQEGNLALRSEITSKDEIGQLAESFNQMTHKLTVQINIAQESKARLLSSIANLPLGFISVDKDYKIKISNSAVKRIFAFKTDDWTLDDINRQLSKKIDMAEIINKTVTNKKIYLIRELEFSDGQFIKMHFVPIITSTKEKDVIGAVILIEDISETKILDRTRDEFFALASHELRTPLTSIRGNASLIKDHFIDKIKNPDFKDIVNDMHTSSVRLINIVEDFLNVSRLEQKKLSFKTEVFDVLPLVKETVKELSMAAKEKNLELKVEMVEGMQGKAQADKDKVRQVLINLINNAIKFTKEGLVTVRVALDGDKIKVDIIDTGKGIAPENQKMLFRKFVQTGESILTRDATRGSGLGLYISKLLMEGMGGSIKLSSSNLGKGSTFSFYLPVSSS